jgi:hypothetical protein
MDAPTTTAPERRKRRPQCYVCRCRIELDRGTTCVDCSRMLDGLRASRRVSRTVYSQATAFLSSPDRLARIELYRRRAELGLPLFEQGARPC